MAAELRLLPAVRTWVLILMVGLIVFTSACSEKNESCEPEDSNYPECLDSGPTG
jgi:hypothetical protein